MITVFYDGKCGLCTKEINYYRKIAPHGIFDWQDITQSSKELEKQGITLSDGLRILHVKDQDGYIHKGVDAFIMIWKHLKFWKILSFLVSLPIIKQTANFSYGFFANWRFKKLDHCQMALKQEKE